jgi:hypothetical protein
MAEETFAMEQRLEEQKRSLKAEMKAAHDLRDEAAEEQ